MQPDRRYIKLDERVAKLFGGFNIFQRFFTQILEASGLDESLIDPVDASIARSQSEHLRHAHKLQFHFDVNLDFSGLLGWNSIPHHTPYILTHIDRLG